VGSVGVVWLRRDLRLADNPALAAAVAACDEVVPLFVWDPRLAGVSGPSRLAFIAGCLEDLQRDLDGRLVVRVHQPATDGRANLAVVEAVAAALGVATGAVRISSGHASRRKVIEVDGDEAALTSRWAELLGDG